MIRVDLPLRRGAAVAIGIVCLATVLSASVGAKANTKDMAIDE
jgi:hypothetical protein